MNEGITKEIRENGQIPSLTLLVFGLGPVVDKKTKQQADKTQALPGEEDINFWSKTAALAVKELVEKKQVAEIIIMGGATGGVQFQTEAQLISNELRDLHITETPIRREDSSDNTLSNIVNFLNQYEDVPHSPTNRHFGLMAANYHLPRVRLLMDLFKIKYDTAFSNEEIIRLTARENEDEKDGQKTLTEIEKRLDMNEASRIPWSKTDYEMGPGYYNLKSGTEQKSIHRRGQEENVFTRALLETPEYWIMYVGQLQSESRIREILKGQDLKMLKDRFEIDLSEDISKIKEKLVAIPRVVPNLDEWIPQPWPEETIKKLDAVNENRKPHEKVLDF
ncbi:MAG: ElyC/SanA/YdcF family protein [bacterium]|nr:ElyC/SanA/YdcF family protein [bacterium]